MAHSRLGTNYRCSLSHTHIAVNHFGCVICRYEVWVQKDITLIILFVLIWGLPELAELANAILAKDKFISVGAVAVICIIDKEHENL